MGKKINKDIQQQQQYNKRKKDEKSNTQCEIKKKFKKASICVCFI